MHFIQHIYQVLKHLGARDAANNKMDKNKQMEQLCFHGILTPPGDSDNEHNDVLIKYRCITNHLLT